MSNIARLQGKMTKPVGDFKVVFDSDKESVSVRATDVVNTGRCFDFIGADGEVVASFPCVTVLYWRRVEAEGK